MIVTGCASTSENDQDRIDFDTNRDGYLSPDEYAASKLSKIVKFEDLDKDGDGLLSHAELAMGHSGRAPGPRKRRSRSLQVNQPN